MVLFYTNRYKEEKMRELKDIIWDEFDERDVTKRLLAASRRSCEARDELVERLDDEQRKLLNKYDDLLVQEKIVEHEELIAFCVDFLKRF